MQSERTSGSQSPHRIPSICLFKVNKLFFLTGAGFSGLSHTSCMFLCVRIKTKGGERETHTNNALRPLNYMNISTCQLNFLKTCLFGGYFLSLSLSCIWKRLKASMPSPPPYQERKSILPKAQQKVLGFNHKHEYLKLQECPQHTAFITQLVFLQQSLLQALGKHNF